MHANSAQVYKVTQTKPAGLLERKKENQRMLASFLDLAQEQSMLVQLLDFISFHFSTCMQSDQTASGGDMMQLDGS